MVSTGHTARFFSIVCGGDLAWWDKHIGLATAEIDTVRLVRLAGFVRVVLRLVVTGDSDCIVPGGSKTQ